MGEVVTKRETPALYDEIDRLRAELANAQAPLTTILAVAEACGLLVLEPREMYDQALVGVTCAPQDHWPRKTAALCAVYSVSRCLAALGAEMAEDEALDWFDFNTRGAWVGEGTPTFVDDTGVDDDDTTMGDIAESPGGDDR